MGRVYGEPVEVQTGEDGLPEPTPRPRTKAAQREATVAALIAVARELFAERGYDGTRVADIAAVAGVSNGALYAHFGSKAELLAGALHAHGRRALPLRIG